MDLALQRCKTAREAIGFIDAILKEHGYASSGESISIADTKEVWLMELVRLFSRHPLHTTLWHPLSRAPCAAAATLARALYYMCIY